METKRTAIFIDAENLYYIQRTLGWEIDFEKLYAFFAEKTYIYNAFYYTAIDRSQEEKHKEKLQLLNGLSLAGYTVRTKDVKIIKTDDGIIKKGNMDVELIIDMFNTKDLYKQVVLFSGDSDFTRALELLRTHGKEIIVVSSKNFVSKELVNAADKYLDILKLQKHIEKKHTPEKTQETHTKSQKSTPTSSQKKVTSANPQEKTRAQTNTTSPQVSKKPVRRRTTTRPTQKAQA